MTLWEYMNKEHGLILVDSEIQEILSLARQEIALPDEEEYMDQSCLLIKQGIGDPTDLKGKWEQQGWLKACKWYENKVRNPYPQTIRFNK